MAVGRFGPYVQYGAKKYASLKKEDDPYTVTLERALEIIREKQQVEANRIIREFPEAGIQVLNGRYGPYITDGKKNGKIPKDREPDFADARRVPGAAGRGTRARHQPLGPQDRREDRGIGGKTAAGTAEAAAAAPKKATKKKAAAPKKKAAPQRKRRPRRSPPEAAPLPLAGEVGAQRRVSSRRRRAQRG